MIEDAVEFSLPGIFIQATMLVFQDLPELVEIMLHVLDGEQWSLILRDSIQQQKNKECYDNSLNKRSLLAILPCRIN